MSAWAAAGRAAPPGTIAPPAGPGEPLLRVSGLVKDYQVSRGVLAREVRCRECRRWRQLRADSRPDVRPGGGVRLRQDHHRQAARGARAGHGGLDRLQRHGAGRDVAASAAAVPARHSAHVPGRVRLAGPAHAGSVDFGRAAGYPENRPAPRPPAPGGEDPGRGGLAGRGGRPVIRASSPAASASGWPSPGR